MERRNQAVDVFKGLNTIGMTLVNTAGPGAPGWLKHSPATGPPTFADAVFPGFVFASGLTAKRRPLLSSVITRTTVLGVYGVFYNLLPIIVKDKSKLSQTSNWRLPSVLGRIGLASAIGSLDGYFPIGVFPIVLTAGWTLLHRNSGDFYDNPLLSADSKLDLAIFGRNHLYSPEQGFDPEGLLGSLLSTPLSYIGGLYFRRCLPTIKSFINDFASGNTKQISSHSTTKRTTAIRLGSWLALSTASTVLGKLLMRAISQPSSKNFWTPAFALETTFTSIASYAVAEAFVELRQLVADVPIGSDIVNYIFSRLQTAGSLSLEFFFMQNLFAALAHVPLVNQTGAFSLIGGALRRFGFSQSTAGVLTSGLLSLLLVEVVAQLEAFDVRLRA